MVDPNPLRGMPLQLQRYWLAGKGAAKIRWNMPGDFMRCVHHLMKYFPPDPKGLCNILHTKATGGPPGHGSLEPRKGHLGTDLHYAAALTAAAQALLDQQPQLGPMWAGPLAPINKATMDVMGSRVFEPGAFTSRSLPLPLDWQKVKTRDGHSGAVTVGRILGMTVGPDHKGQDYLWGWGDWLNPDIIPEVNAARYLMQQGVAGASLDPGGPIQGTMNPDTGAAHMSTYTVGGATLVSIPAFSDMRLTDLGAAGDWANDDPDMDPQSVDDGCGCGNESAMDQLQDLTPASNAAVNMGNAIHMGVGNEASEGYEPTLVPDTTNDTGNIQPLATGDEVVLDLVPQFTVNSDGWRGLPLAPRSAVFDNDDAILRITQWASQGGNTPDPAKMNQMFMWRDPKGNPQDPTAYRLPIGDIVSGRPTLIFHAIYAAAALLSGAHGGLPDIPDAEKMELRRTISAIYPEMAKAFDDANIRAPWDRPANTAAREDAQGAFAMADNPKLPYGDVDYADPGYQQDKQKRYPLDTPDHIRAAWSYINMPRNAGQYNPEQLKAIKAKIVAAAKKAGIEISQNQMSLAMPEYPSKLWFEDPQLSAKTPLQVTEGGHVYGHLAAWGECHRDITNRECVLAPHSRKNYDPFHLGTVFTAEGDTVRVGKIVMDTRHAGIDLNYRSAAIHYDNTGDEVAVVRAGEDEYGIWVAGAVVPEADDRKVQKLRRSPLSGDWRALEGNLELTAALAVNVPAFPVFSMQGEERLALVAAGTVVHAMSDEHYVDDTVSAELSNEQEDRMWELLAVDEDHANWDQWQRSLQLAEFAVMAGETVPDVSPDPLYSDQAMAARQMDAQYEVVEDTGPGTENTVMTK